MARPSNIDQLEAALRAGAVLGDPLTEPERRKVDAWIIENPERYAAIRRASVNLAREMVAQVIQREGQREEVVRSIGLRLRENPQLREKVMGRISENAGQLLTEDRKERILGIFGIRLGDARETLRQRVAPTP
jgi:hypothetical protein